MNLSYTVITFESDYQGNGTTIEADTYLVRHPSDYDGRVITAEDIAHDSMIAIVHDGYVHVVRADATNDWLELDEALELIAEGKASFVGWLEKAWNITSKYQPKGHTGFVSSTSYETLGDLYGSLFPTSEAADAAADTLRQWAASTAGEENGDYSDTIYEVEEA